MDKSLIILALETLREQVFNGTDWSDGISGVEGQERLERIDEQIEELKAKSIDTNMPKFITRAVNECTQTKNEW